MSTITRKPKRANSRKELIQIVGLPQYFADQVYRYRDSIPVNADIVDGTLYSAVDVTDLFNLPVCLRPNRYISFFEADGIPLVATNLSIRRQLEAPASFAVKGI